MSEKEIWETAEMFAAFPKETRVGFAVGYVCGKSLAETQAHAQEQEQQDQQDQQPPA